MCGRYELIDGQRVFIRFRVTNTVPPILDNTDVRPTQQVFALQTDHVLSLMKWGLIPPWAKDPSVGSKMINARACIIPASAFFEWKGNPGAKVKYRIARKDGDLFGFAGLYEHWRDPNTDGELTTCTIITPQPNELVAPIHNRMPVILLPEDEDHWLDPAMSEPEEITSLLRPYPADLMMASRT